MNFWGTHPFIKVTAMLATGLGLVSCAIVRGTVYNKPSVGDRKLFSCCCFPASAEPRPFSQQLIPSMQLSPEFMDSTQTGAYLIVKDGTIVSESYSKGYCKEEQADLFSISKSVVSLLLGIAIQDGKVGSILDRVGGYLPNIDASVAALKLVDLLDMRSGIKNTFWLKTIHYYGYNLTHSVRLARVDSHKTGRFEYSDCSTQLLSLVIEAAVGQSLTAYFREKLWEPLHMEHEGSWTFDSKRHQHARAFCGLNMTARDVAKIGVLCLNNGVYAGVQVVPSQWIESTTILRHSDPTRLDGYCYNNHWRIVSTSSYFAKGLLGQYLYIDKAHNTVIVRLGTKQGGLDWIPRFKGLSE